MDDIVKNCEGSEFVSWLSAYNLAWHIFKYAREDTRHLGRIRRTLLIVAQKQDELQVCVRFPCSISYRVTFRGPSGCGVGPEGLIEETEILYIEQ